MSHRPSEAQSLQDHSNEKEKSRATDPESSSIRIPGKEDKDAPASWAAQCCRWSGPGSATWDLWTSNEPSASARLVGQPQMRLHGFDPRVTVGVMPWAPFSLRNWHHLQFYWFAFDQFTSMATLHNGGMASRSSSSYGIWFCRWLRLQLWQVAIGFIRPMGAHVMRKCWGGGFGGNINIKRGRGVSWTPLT